MKKRLIYQFVLSSLSLYGFIFMTSSLYAQMESEEKSSKEDFRPYKLKEIGIGMNFFHWDSKQEINNSFSKLVNFQLFFSRTYHKKSFWAPGWQIEPFTGFSTINLTEAGRIQTPDSLTYASAGYKSFQSSFGIFNRFSFKTGGKEVRLRHPVIYLDAGISGAISWLFRYVSRSDSSEFGRRETIVQRGIRRNPMILGNLKLGWGPFCLFASWRITRFFPSGILLPETPKLQAGFLLQIPLFKPARKTPTWNI